jgi:hypothetical protein
MVSVTLSVPPELKQNMDKYSWVNWSGLARETFSEKIEELRLLDKFKSKSKLTLKQLNREMAEARISDEDSTEIIRKMRGRRLKSFEKW